jgi:hypothetical protein
MVVTTVADDLKQLGYTLSDTDPEEFHVLRHLRNAAAHGNRFEIRNQNARTVSFRELTISPARDGEPDVFFYARHAVARHGPHQRGGLPYMNRTGIAPGPRPLDGSTTREITPMLNGP